MVASESSKDSPASVRIWNFHSGRLVRELSHIAEIDSQHVSISDDGRSMATATFESGEYFRIEAVPLHQPLEMTDGFSVMQRNQPTGSITCPHLQL